MPRLGELHPSTTENCHHNAERRTRGEQVHCHDGRRNDDAAQSDHEQWSAQQNNDPQEQGSLPVMTPAKSRKMAACPPTQRWSTVPPSAGESTSGRRRSIKRLL